MWRRRIGNAEAGYTLKTWPTNPPRSSTTSTSGCERAARCASSAAGEPLTTEEQEAIGRWERLSSWRKAIAIGAFSVGTFGLGFTLGGLIFGRWRKA